MDNKDKINQNHIKKCSIFIGQYIYALKNRTQILLTSSFFEICWISFF